MRPMTSLTQPSRTSLRTWHEEQQPLVRALATPMVEEITSALDGLQVAIDDRDNLLAAVSAQLSTLNERVVSLEAEAQTQVARLSSQLEATTARLEVTTTQLKTAKADLVTSHETVTDLAAKVEITTDRIHVLERQMFGRKSEKKKTPDAREGARKRRRSELSTEEKKRRREAAAAKRQAKLDALRTVSHTVKVPEAFQQGRQLPPVMSVLYEWHPGELVRIQIAREQWIQPDDLAIVTAPPSSRWWRGQLWPRPLREDRRGQGAQRAAAASAGADVQAPRCADADVDVGQPVPPYWGSGARALRGTGSPCLDRPPHLCG